MASRPPNIDPAETWVTSDSHFGHQNIVGFCHRPTDHEQILMEEWAKAVPDGGTVLHLGDISYKNNAMFQHVFSKHLTGARKLLIRGNHDRGRPSFYRNSGFQVVKPFSIEYIADPHDHPYRISFSHYALRADEKPDDYHIHIHGHIHNSGYGGATAPYTPFSRNQINISVEQTHYRPVNLKALLDGYILGCYEPPRPAKITEPDENVDESANNQSE